jgi:hypothetical protein
MAVLISVAHWLYACRILGKTIILDFKLSPFCECCILSYGWFPGIWILCADVSEHSVHITYEDGRGCSETFINLLVCLTTGPKPLPKWALHIVRYRASSFRWQYPLFSLRSSNSFLRLVPRLPVTSILPFIFPSVTCCTRQFLRKMWPIQLTFRLLSYFRNVST